MFDVKRSGEMMSNSVGGSTAMKAEPQGGLGVFVSECRWLVLWSLLGLIGVGAAVAVGDLSWGKVGVEALGFAVLVATGIWCSKNGMNVRGDRFARSAGTGRSARRAVRQEAGFPVWVLFSIITGLCAGVVLTHILYLFLM